MAVGQVGVVAAALIGTELDAIQAARVSLTPGPGPSLLVN
jgi:hypothetical protein